jgi:ATP-binding cassette subfamily C protein PrsD
LRGSEGPLALKIGGALSVHWNAFVSVGLFSAVINVLSLTGAIFMLEVYDRVLPGRSVPTLVGLTIIAGVLFAAQGFLDVVRSRMLIRIASALDAQLTDRIYRLIIRIPLKLGGKVDALRPLRDLDQIRSFLSGGGPLAIFDLPWMPFYLAICFLFHVWIGTTVLVGAIVLAALALLTEIKSRGPVRASEISGTKRLRVVQASVRNAEAVEALGMRQRMAETWGTANANHVNELQRAFDVTGGYGAVAKVVRIALQSAVLGVGAWLVIQQQASPGIIIASSIIAARALAPVEQAIGHWRGLVAARESKNRLDTLLAGAGSAEAPLPLPAPEGHVSVENISVVPPGSERLIITDVSFTLAAGQALGVTGPSASGKSTLVRTLVGAWKPVRGRVRLDGAALDQWDSDALGRHIGYLPQDVELFGGTVADNISRFQPDADPEKIIAAAKAAGVHDMIVRLPGGYAAEVGENGEALSAGQRQRIGLARALYGDPFLVVLDEPNAHLDAEGEEAVSQAIADVRRRGGIAIVVAHRRSALANVDQMLVMTAGRLAAFGPKEDVLQKYGRPSPPSQPSPPLTVVPLKS